MGISVDVQGVGMAKVLLAVENLVNESRCYYQTILLTARRLRMIGMITQLQY